MNFIVAEPQGGSPIASTSAQSDTTGSETSPEVVEDIQADTTQTEIADANSPQSEVLDETVSSAICYPRDQI